jgi:hypothetical protein
VLDVVVRRVNLQMATMASSQDRSLKIKNMENDGPSSFKKYVRLLYDVLWTWMTRNMEKYIRCRQDDERFYVEARRRCQRCVHTRQSATYFDMEHFETIFK